jgi:hypothetical protein
VFGADSVGFIPAERDYMDPTTETQGGNLQAWNNLILAIIFQGHKRPGVYSHAEIAASQLPKLFITHSNFVKQAAQLNELWTELGFPGLEIAANKG